MTRIDYLHLLAANLRDPDERIRFIESTRAVLISNLVSKGNRGSSNHKVCWFETSLKSIQVKIKSSAKYIFFKKKQPKSHQNEMHQNKIHQNKIHENRIHQNKNCPKICPKNVQKNLQETIQKIAKEIE